MVGEAVLSPRDRAPKLRSEDSRRATKPVWPTMLVRRKTMCGALYWLERCERPMAWIMPDTSGLSCTMMWLRLMSLGFSRLLCRLTPVPPAADSTATRFLPAMNAAMSFCLSCAPRAVILPSMTRLSRPVISATWLAPKRPITWSTAPVGRPSSRAMMLAGTRSSAVSGASLTLDTRKSDPR